MPKEVHEYKENVANFARLTYSGKVREDNLRVEIEHYFSDNRRRDCTNYSKALLDSLENVVYKNDTQLVDVRMKLLHADTDYSIIKIYDDL
jgi:Holliday junction resolvase RusA-like endonuclease